MTCDTVLLQGSVLVDESILTGESIPVIKKELQKNNNKFVYKDASQHVLFKGSIIQKIKEYKFDEN